VLQPGLPATPFTSYCYNCVVSANRPGNGWTECSILS